MKRARREERRRESGGRGRTQRNGERKKKKKENWKDMVHVIKFHGIYSGNTTPSTCKVILGIWYKQEAFPGRIFTSK